MREVEHLAVAAYERCFGSPPTVVVSAPGRLNLLGEHTDYNQGFVLPCAIDRRIACALGPGDNQLYAAHFDELSPVLEAARGTWADYPSGVIWALGEAGHTAPTLQAAYAGDVPVGAGLSSSAAIEAATALAIDTYASLNLSRIDLALLCQRAENAFVGVNSGIMDQFASLLAGEDAALLIDCRTLTASAVPLNLGATGLALLVCDTREHRKLSETAYNQRRVSCEQAARILGVASLRDATLAHLPELHGELLRQTRHIITENRRVMDGAEALRRGDHREFGRLMLASHVSLRDDFAVSTQPLDTVVDVAMRSGALGARLTGAGFGGCAIAFIPRIDADAMIDATRDAFAVHGFAQPDFYFIEPGAGGEVVLIQRPHGESTSVRRSSDPGCIGVVGAGAFGRFCIEAYTHTPDLRVVAAADPDASALAQIGQLEIRREADWDRLLTDERIEVIHVATPPFLRGDVVLAALAAGKSVFAEKPLALTLTEVDLLIDAASHHGVTLGIDYVMRHLPAYDLLERLARSELFGPLRSISFVNFAQTVPADHWFWRRERSGGILVEHGVHFLDAYGRIAGEAIDVRGTTLRESAIDLTVRYAGGALARYYHEFAFPLAVERTAGISMFERGRIEIDGWIPERLTGAVLAPADELVAAANYPELALQQEGDVTRFAVEFPNRAERYREAVVAGMRDVVQRHRDPAYPLRVSAEDGRRSLALALIGQLSADTGELLHLPLTSHSPQSHGM